MIIIKEITIFNVTSIPTLRINASYINDVKGMLQEFWKIDMFLETFRLLACAISNFV